ncbi:MAG: CbtA family protein [Candidatus Nitrosopolaris sp.]|jgi:predicted cobalt transporter CbtA
MKTLTFICITLLSGAIAGTLLGLINQVVVEPYIDKAIGIQTQRAIDAGQTIDPMQQSNYRMWQKGGEIVAATIYGISLSALFGVIFAYSRNSKLLPGSNNKVKTLVLAGIMFFVLFLVPSFKYPANPPGVGDPKTIYLREDLYVGFILSSGFTALGLAFVYTKFENNNSLWSKKKLMVLPLIYAMIMVTAYVFFPPNPDKVTIPMDLLTSFRIAGAFTIGIFWWLMAVILGTFWDKLKPNETSKIVSR